MTVIGRLWNGRVEKPRSVAPFVKVEELPVEFRPTGTRLNTGDLTVEDMCREIKALNFTIEEQQRRMEYLEANRYVHQTEGLD